MGRGGSGAKRACWARPCPRQRGFPTGPPPLLLVCHHTLSGPRTRTPGPPVACLWVRAWVRAPPRRWVVKAWGARRACPPPGCCPGCTSLRRPPGRGHAQCTASIAAGHTWSPCHRCCRRNACGSCIRRAGVEPRVPAARRLHGSRRRRCHSGPFYHLLALPWRPPAPPRRLPSPCSTSALHLARARPGWRPRWRPLPPLRPRPPSSDREAQAACAAPCPAPWHHLCLRLLYLCRCRHRQRRGIPPFPLPPPTGAPSTVPTPCLEEVQRWPRRRRRGPPPARPEHRGR